MRTWFGAGVLLGMLAACEATPTPDCAGSAVSGTASASGIQGVWRAEELLVTGTATSAGLAIRSLRVGPVAATPEVPNNNFATWSATLGAATLVSLAEPDSSGVGALTLEAVATDSCGQEWPIGEPIALEVDLSPEVVVSSLELEVEIPSGQGYLPVHGGVAGVVWLTANADAAGAEVSLSTSLGAFSPADTLTLSGDGSAQAQATALLVGEGAADAGTALLTATAEGELASATVRFAGAPWLSPETLALEPGDRATVLVRSEGAIDACSAYAERTGDIAVTAGGVSLYGNSVSDTDGDGVLELTLEVSDNLVEEAEVQVRCCDLYGQCSSSAAGVYTADGG